MRAWARLVAVFLLLLACGCTLTLHSLFTPEDVVHDPALDGVWQQDDTVWTIRTFNQATGRYSLRTDMKDQPPAAFKATLGTVGSHRFLELTPERPDDIHAKTFVGGHFVPLRSFWKVRLVGDELTLTPMSSQWLDAMIKKNQLNISCERPEGGLLFLTTSTPELRELVAKYADDPGAFPATGDEKGLVLSRTPPVSAPSERSHHQE